jgi:hypothetical protein
MLQGRIPPPPAAVGRNGASPPRKSSNHHRCCAAGRAGHLRRPWEGTSSSRATTREAPRAPISSPTPAPTARPRLPRPRRPLSRSAPRCGFVPRAPRPSSSPLILPNRRAASKGVTLARWIWAPAPRSHISFCLPTNQVTNLSIHDQSTLVGQDGNQSIGRDSWRVIMTAAGGEGLRLRLHLHRRLGHEWVLQQACR